MILEKQTNAIIQEEGETQDSIGMSLDLDSAQILMQMLSKNLYSDSIGSTVRECASNALDSHRRAGVNDPIIVSFKANAENNYEFSVEDFGIGLDADDVKNIISKYGKSTKRNSNTELGMMGLGFKAPLAYSSSFYFICRKDGMERKYMMYEGEETNTIDLLYEKPTTERNGVKVIVPVKYSDRTEFASKISEQLAYFENVYFDCAGKVDNNFIIHRTELFQFSQLATDNNLHICLDNVYYPIDFQKLGVQVIRFPIGIRLSLNDGVFPTPNRESIRYTKESREIILDKIRQIADYFIDKYNESILDTDNVQEVFNFYGTNERYLLLGEGKKDVSVFQQYTTKQIKSPKLKGVDYLNLSLLYRNKEYIFKEYEKRYSIERGKWRESKNHYSRELNFRDVKSDNCFIYSEKIPGKKKDYIKEKYGNGTTWGNYKYILKKTAPFTLGKHGNVDYSTYMYLLGLNTYPKYKWRTVIQEFQTILKYYTDKFIDIDALEVPQDWIDSRKKAKILISGTSGPAQRRVKLKGEIVGKEASKLERWVDGKNCKWVSNVYKLEDIHKEKCLVVYGGAESVATMDKLYKIVDSGRIATKLKFIQFSDRELKNLEKINVHNWIKLETFMEGKNKPFKRLVTAYLIEKLVTQFNRRDKLKVISEDLSEKLDVLKKYVSNNCVYGSEKIYESMLEVAEEHNLFDYEVYHVYKDVKNLCEKLTFLQPLCDKLSSWGTVEGDPILKAIGDLFKYYKHRIDWKNYNIKLNDEVAPKQPLTEEIVEELLED